MNMNMNIKRLIGILIIGAIFMGIFSGCFRREETDKPSTPEMINLVYYRMFDDEDVIRPLIQQYQADHPNVQITYKKFTDLEEYEDLIINELAEGEGPDMFSAPNYWILPNLKKISPAPSDIVPTDSFDATFVSVASDDLILRDPADGIEKVYGIPLMVDTLVLYYNRGAYEDKIPSRGKPPVTWDEMQEDVFTLTKRDQSFERFEQAGIALGRSDNIARSTDILLMMMIQYGADFYNDNISRAEFSKQMERGSTGTSINPAQKALKLYTSFALPTNKNYSWNQYLADANSASKELDAFAKGKVVMVFGYSYMYEQIRSKIQELDSKGVSTISMENVGIAAAPQVIDPATSTEKRDAYANYFAETVSRTSAHQKEAWDFLVFMSNQENLQYYNEKTHRPTSRRDMIEEQMQDPIYGVFAEQIGYAESVPIYDYAKYSEIFSEAIASILATGSVNDAVREAEEKINALLPSDGLIEPLPEQTQ